LEGKIRNTYDWVYQGNDGRKKEFVYRCDYNNMLDTKMEKNKKEGN